MQPDGTDTLSCLNHQRSSLFPVLPPCLYITCSPSPSCQAELQQLEDQLYKERKERERIVGSYRKQVEEHSAQAEKVDRRVRGACCCECLTHELESFYSCVAEPVRPSDSENGDAAG